MMLNFGVVQRQRAMSRGSTALRVVTVGLPLVLAVSAGIWWNGLLDPHEVAKLAVLLVGVGVVSVVWGLYGLRQVPVQRPLPYSLCLLTAAIVATAFASSLHAPSVLLAWLGVGGAISGSLATTVVAISVFLLAASLRVAGWKPRWTPFAVTYLGVLLLAGIQRLGWVDLSPGGGAARLFSPLGNEIMVTWLTVLALVMATSLRALPWSRWLVMLVGFGWLFWVDSLTAWLVLLGTVLTGQLLYLARPVASERVFWSVPGRLVLALSALGLICTVPRSPGMPVLLSPSWQQSAEVVKAAWKESVVLGVGQGQWSSIFERIRPVEANLGSIFLLRFDVGANWWFTSAAQEGVLGTVVRVAFGLVLLLHVTRLAVRDPDRLPDLMLTVLVLGMLFVVHPYSWLIVSGFAMMGYAAGEAYEWPNFGGRLFSGEVLVLGVFALMLLWWHAPRIVADGYARRALEAPNQEKRIEYLVRATHIAWWVPDYVYALTQARTRQIVAQLLDASVPNSVVQEALAQGIAEAKAGTSRWPTLADMWLAQGTLYSAIAPATQGADQFAIQSYQEGMRYAPQHPGFPLGIAQVYVRRAEVAAPASISASSTAAVAEYRLEQRRLAAEWFRRALERKPDDQGILYAYATNVVRAGDVATALPIFRSLVASQPDRVDLGLEYGTVLAFAKQYDAAIPYAQRVSSADPLYDTSRRLLTDWYVAKQDWVHALAAWKSLPASEQSTATFRTRLRELESKAGTTGSR